MHLVNKILKNFKKDPHIFILITILLLAIFFRTYAVVDRFEFSQDGDLYSWIVKDIVVNRDLRLIGQETSAPGIFIGPLFYYSITPFFLLTNMDPIGAIIPVTIVGILAVFSYFFVFSKLYNVQIGLIASFLYTVLLETVQLDRRVVPSTPTNLWVIWYFFTIIMLVRGNFKVLPVLGILIGLIWHIHIALAPTLMAVPVAIFLSRKIPNLKQILSFVICLTITFIPLAFFEIKNNFVQTTGLIDNFGKTPEGIATGFYKMQLVMEMVIKNIHNLFFVPHHFPFLQNIVLFFAILLMGLWAINKKLIQWKELVVLYSWLFGVIIFFSVSSSIISEYYFFNLNVIFILLTTLLIFYVYKNSTPGKVIIIILFLIITLKNIHFMITQDYYHKGYLEKKEIVNYIVNDAKDKSYPCFSINYITSPGENVGFRYFFYLKNAHIGVAGRGSPVYSIVIPDEYAKDEIEAKFGHIGIITPKNIGTRQLISEACSGANTNLTDPMLGFVD